jgi:diguanylate cyclase (GGDEF)-like protein
MLIIDARTIAISYTLTNLLCAIVIAILWTQNRKRFDGIGFWLTNFALQFLGMLLVVLRTIVPDFLSMTVSNTLTIAGAIFILIGLSRFIGQPSRQTHNFIGLAIFAIVHAYFVFVVPNLNVRILLFSSGVLVTSFQGAWLMLRQVESEKRAFTRGVGHVFVGFCVVSVVRIVFTLTLSQRNDLFQSGPFETLLLLSFQLLLIGLTFALSLMVAQRLFIELDRHAMTDELTGLANRRYFFIKGPEELKRAQRYQTGLSLIMMDIDKFKLVNDKYGHETGDIVLRRIASTIKANVREVDTVARLGGEEIAVLLPNTEAADAIKLAERLRSTIEAELYSNQDRPLSVTASIGVAYFDENITDFDDLLRTADAAMYKAKDLGRNQVVLLG